MIHAHIPGALRLMHLGLQMGKFEEYAKFIGSVGFAIVIIGLFQKNVMQVPIVGAYLPGAKSAAA